MLVLRRPTVGALAVLAATTLLFAQGQEQEKRTYVGVDNCRMCHIGIYKSWRQKPHARAYDLLVAAKQEKNEQCLKCHTTGYGTGGFVDAEKTPGLKGVTCEACHGPGSEHNGDASKITKVPPASVCTGCHMTADIH
jgi:predicted CXXCH cytochrome family protein